MIDTLLLVTLFLSAVAIFTAWRVNRLVVSGVVAFWASWLTLVVSAWFSVRLEILSEIPESSFDYVYSAYAGAFIGSMVGIFAAGNAKRRITDTPDWRRLTSSAEWLAKHFLLPVVLVSLTTGLIHFVQRWALIDFDFFKIYELRVITREAAWPWAARLASYSSMVCLLLLMMMGTADAEYGVRTKRLAWMWVSTMPHGMAFAGRGWTLAPLIFYAASYLISRQCSARPRSLRALAPVGALAMVGLWSFVVLGSVRNRQMSSEQVEQLSLSQWDDGQKYMVAGWLGSSMGAVGVQSDFVAELNPTWGVATFDWFSRKAAQWGFTYSRSHAKWDYWRLNVLPYSGKNGSTWCVPSTAIPWLILDYGTDGMPIALGIMVALLHWLSVRWIGQGIFRSTVAFLSLNALFSSIQFLNLFSAVNVIVLISALLASLILPQVDPAQISEDASTGDLTLKAGATADAH